jgi:hypothetical protein
LDPRAQQRQRPLASLEELRQLHTARYLEAVQSLDLFADDPLLAPEATRWGLGLAIRLHSFRRMLPRRSPPPAVATAAAVRRRVVGPLTEEDSWLASLESLLPALAGWFAPDTSLASSCNSATYQSWSCDRLP